jgi:hypothetical protein
MSNDNTKTVDLTPTIKELAPEHAEVWHNFMRAAAIVGVAVGVLLVGMWFFLYYIKP